jgi:transposase/predicted transcriptional regulator
MAYRHLTTEERHIAARLVLDMKMTEEFAAQALACSQPTISRIITRLLNTGELDEVRPPGRQPLYDITHMENLEHTIEQNRNSTAAGLQHLVPPSAPPVSDTTLQRYRRQLDMTPRRQSLTSRQTGPYEAQRRGWAWEHRRDPAFYWVHTDECTVRMQQTGDIVWVKRGQPTPRWEVETLRCHVNVWGAVWDEGRVFAQFGGHLNTDLFITLLNTHLLPKKENLVGRTLLIDLHPVHRTKTVKDWLSQHGFNYIFLPPHSPQFNAIEGCWGWMKRYVRKLRPTTEAELTLAMQEAGEVLPLDVIQAHLEHAQGSIRDWAWEEEGEE